MAKDILFKREERTGKFRFDANTTAVFDDMLQRSVPFYAEIQRMIVEISLVYAQQNSSIYDIGCSTGNTILNLRKSLEAEKNINIIGLDNSRSMLEAAEKKLKRHGLREGYSLRDADVNRDFDSNRVDVSGASVVIMNLVLQFSDTDKRPAVLKMIHKGLKKGGCLIFIEKIRPDDRRFDKQFVNFYHGLKARNRYSQKEIIRKKEALKKVLVPFTPSRNEQLLRRAGFKSVECFFRWYNFCGVIAVK